MELYELADTYLVLQDSDENEYESALVGIEDDIGSQIENIGKVIKNISAEKDAYKTEISRMQTQIKSLDSRIDRLKEYLKTNMELVGINKAGEIVKVSLRNSPPSCTVVDLTQVPDDFKTAKTSIPLTELPKKLKKYITEEVISKKEIVDLWKDGIDIDGTEVVRNKHVRVS